MSDRNVGLRKTRDKTCSFLRPATMANGSNLGQSPAVLQQEFFARALQSLTLAYFTPCMAPVQPLRGSARHRGFCWRRSR